MTTHPHLAGVLTDLDAVIADAPADATGALWRLTGSGRGLDSNLIRLRPRAVIGEHAEPALDVLLVVVEGGGRMDTDDGPLDLRPHSAVWLARNARRSLTAGPDGLTYLTVHTRRPGLGIGTAAAGAPADRPAPMPAALPAPEGGEPACLLHRVCADCGRPATESAARYCSRCGERLPD
ncbi:cupin domain-containing protein [Streptomyces sp. NPDC057939]|uniref:cupin domain-containing protein n=1 Tax=Streptomyces sp. NPDC057939 TaxID=3346284 RepID=UPI0036E976A0